MGDPTAKGARLHIFCDAGADAYGAVAWLQNGKELMFVLAKSFVSPLKTKTIPRLELLSAQLAARMLRGLKKQFGDIKATIWCDLSIVLKWIKTGVKKYKAFMAARLQEIHENVEGAEHVYRCIRGDINPADALTRVVVNTSEEMTDWLRGLTVESLETKPEEQPRELMEKERKEMMKEERKKKTRKKKKAKRQVAQRKTTVEKEDHQQGIEASEKPDEQCEAEKLAPGFKS